MNKTLYDYYLEIANPRGKLKNVEDYKNPALFWCSLFHIDDNGEKITII